MRRQDRDRLSFALLGALAGVVLVASACSSGRRPTDEGDADADAAEVDADVDADADEAPDVAWDGDIGDPSSVPNCGDGVLDPEEECDDHNRLNGDGCDWVCRLGDGPPTPNPDPDTPDYGPSGPEVEEEGTTVRGLGSVPLVWNGSNLAAVLVEPAADDELQAHARFLEATVEGVIGGSDWNYPIETEYLGGEEEYFRLELVWTGEGYGLFYTVPVSDEPSMWTSELWFLSLDETGKAMGEPVLLAEGWYINYIEADLTDRGFVVAWSTWRDDTGSTCGGPVHLSSLTVQLVAFDGTSDGFPEPELISDQVVGRPAIAAGDDGFGLMMVENGTEDEPACSTSFLRLSPDLAETATSGALANAVMNDMEFDGEEYVVATAHYEDHDPWAPGELCVARYASSGMLSSPPVCNGRWTGHEVRFDGISLAIGDDGLAVMLLTHYNGLGDDFWPRINFFRTDLAGRQVSDPTEIDHAPEIGGASIVWTGDGFTSLHTRNGAAETDPDTLVFNRFTRE